MALETERKFLVTGDFKRESFLAVRIKQAYLCSAPGRTVRVRIKGDRGFLTIKGAGNESGASRFEWEKEIPLADADALMELAEPGLIDKTRYLIRNTDGLHTWEVDEFHGANEGLVLAEIELGREDEPFDRPSWLGEEVTGDPRYYNSTLSKR
ncbi:MAG: CYTH domain-containing protein [Bacteroidales bacterium]|nr:CYTH domain-containing protein [Bacteroidales bacterium]